MVSLNLDCWEVVFNFLEPETRTLYNCLFVSKTFFHVSTKVLYRRPLETFNQREFSLFSETRLESLLLARSESSNITPVTSPTATTDQEQPTTGATPTTSIATTTIDYYKLVVEYPKSFVAYTGDPDFKDRVTRFAETIPHMYIDHDAFDVVIPLVSRFKALHTLHIHPPTKSVLVQRGAFGSEILIKILQFVESHHRLFPGLLKFLPNSEVWSNWQEFTTVAKAMGGVVDFNLELYPGRFERDLGQLMVSRLKRLTLTGDTKLVGVELKAIQFLKLCTGLETLVLKWPRTMVMDWDMLLEDPESSQSGGGNSVSGGFNSNSQSNESGYGSQDKKPLPLSKLIIQHQPLQRLRPRFGLKHLVVFADVRLTIQVMKLFSETLESIKLQTSYDDMYRSCEHFDWENSFILPRLKSIRCSRYIFEFKNLESCPVLETLLLSNESRSNRFSQESSWPLMKTNLLPLSIRKLHLVDTRADGFNVSHLKPLILLEDLHLDGQTYDESPQLPGYVNMFDNMSLENGWWFPNLQNVNLIGTFAVQIQGQILWIAPKLQTFRLSLWLNKDTFELDINTFLFPPLLLDLKNTRYSKETKQTTRLAKKPTICSTLKSTASFPELKCLKLSLFQLPKSLSAQAFGDEFFGPRPSNETKPRLKLPQASRGNSDDHDIRTNTRTTIMDSTHHSPESNRGDKNQKSHDDEMKRYLFPNLEELVFYWSKPHNHLLPVVLKAMRDMPKLERVFYWERLEKTTYDSFADWLQIVPRDGTGSPHRDRRNRPLAVEGVNGNQGSGNNRCVVQFDKPLNVRYQLKPKLLEKVGTEAKHPRAMIASAWNHLLSRKK